MVVQAHVRLSHEGCYSRDLPEGASLDHLACGTRAGLSLLRTRSAEETAAVIRRMRRDPHGVEVLEESPRAAIVRCGCRAQHIAWTPRAEGWAYHLPVTYAGGFEHYLFVARSKEDLAEPLRALQQHGRIEIDRLVETPLEALGVRIGVGEIATQLSPRQFGALHDAIRGGYYERPRLASAKDLARRAGLARSTYLEHLRKAEVRVMSTLGRTLVEHPALREAATKRAGRPRKARGRATVGAPTPSTRPPGAQRV